MLAIKSNQQSIISIFLQSILTILSWDNLSTRLSRWITKNFTSEVPEVTKAISDDEQYIDQLHQDLGKNMAIISGLKQELLTTQHAKQSLEEEMIQLEYSKDLITYQFDEVKTQNEVLKKRSDTIYNMSQLPSTALLCMTTIAGVFSDKLAITPEAIKSAKEYVGNNICGIWELFWLFPTELHQMLFETDMDSHQITVAFKNSFNYDLTFTDGKNTKRDAELMDLRNVIYNGKPLSIMAHAKITKGSCCFRIYFGVDRIKKVIVIGSFGNHKADYSSKA